jgi:RNA polymerase sigma-70 factor (ECF subfamily)
VEPVESLFRHESGRMISVLTRIFGFHNLALVEDVVQDAFCRALEVWKFRGLPDDPAAWLMASAKNRAIDVLRRERTARVFAPELGRLADSEWTLVPAVEERFAPHALQDDLLRMMFSCCDPRLQEEAQVALILHILCGFSVGEVAGALVAGHAAVEKRIGRAKKVLAGSRSLFEIADAKQVSARLPAVQRALYLLFNEGYHGASTEAVVRDELCREAIRLATLLQRHAAGDTPATRALLALLYLHAARLPSRLDAHGDLLPLFDQDRSRWDRSLLAAGEHWLEEAAAGTELTDYHVEAAIAWVHGSAPSAAETDWRRIVSLYDQLLALRPSPVIALNRAIAIAQLEGPERGLAEIAGIGRAEKLASYPFYPAAMGELELRRGQREAARGHFQSARSLARNASERRFFEQRVEACGARTEAAS